MAHIPKRKTTVNKYYLLNTLTYEIGHALGLSHSSREDSIMFAFAGTNNNSNKIVKLNLEDILAIQQLYGIKNPRLTTTTQIPNHQLPKLRRINSST